jgi:two-component system chemotaxis response regulator CheY
MNAKILVADTDKSARELLQLHLSNAGYAVMLANDAIAGGRLLLEERPNLLVIEAEMPFMSGVELLQAIRSDFSVAHIPAILFAATAEHELEAKRLGASVLRKPVHLDQLLSAVTKELGTTEERFINLVMARVQRSATPRAIPVPAAA